MTQQDPLRNAINQMKARLDPASGLPLSRDQLATKLGDLGKNFDKARAGKTEAKLIGEGVAIAVQLKTRTGEMAAETHQLVTDTIRAYQEHFGEDEEASPAAPAPGASAQP